jgi:hypothetical protein
LPPEGLPIDRTPRVLADYLLRLLLAVVVTAVRKGTGGERLQEQSGLGAQETK